MQPPTPMEKLIDWIIDLTADGHPVAFFALLAWALCAGATLVGLAVWAAGAL